MAQENLIESAADHKASAWFLASAAVTGGVAAAAMDQRDVPPAEVDGAFPVDGASVHLDEWLVGDGSYRLAQLLALHRGDPGVGDYGRGQADGQAHVDVPGPTLTQTGGARDLDESHTAR